MKILVIHNQLWAHYKSILFQEIYRVLQRENPEAEFLVAQIALYEQSRASMVDRNTSPEYEYPYKVLFHKSLESVTFFGRLKSLVSLFRSYKPDILNITGYFDFAQVVLLIYAKLKGIKTVISTESSLVDKPRFGLKENVKKYILNQADAYFCFGSTSVDYLRSLDIQSQKIMVKKAAVVDNDRITQHCKHLRGAHKQNLLQNFVYIGRLAPEKNLLYLLKGYQNIISEGTLKSNWGLLLIGEGPERTLLENYVSLQNLPNVSFTGGVPWQEVPNWLAKADVLILPSLSEPWGLVVNEAMLCGMPVIVSEKCGCAQDLVRPGENGFLVDPSNVNTLSDAMMYYCQNPEKVQIHGRASSEIIEPFSPQKVAKQMVNSYQFLFKNN